MKKQKSIRAQLKDLFLLGIISVTPLWLTAWVLLSIWQFVDKQFNPLIPEEFKFPGLGILILLFCLLLVGAMAKTVGGRLINSWFEAIFNRLPIAGSIYKIVKQIANAIFSTDSTASFKRVVKVPFPHEMSKSLGFVTFQDNKTGELTIYVPTSPNPTSGYVLFFDESKVEEADYTVDEALRLVLSGGAVGHRRVSSGPRPDEEADGR